MPCLSVLLLQDGLLQRQRLSWPNRMPVIKVSRTRQLHVSM